jgi:hypothetical protein
MGAVFDGASGALLLCKVLVGKDKVIPSIGYTQNPYQHLRPHHRFTTIVMQPLFLCRNRPYGRGRATICKASDKQGASVNQTLTRTYQTRAIGRTTRISWRSSQRRCCPSTASAFERGSEKVD